MSLIQLAILNKNLFWDVKDINQLSDSALLERLINYSDWETFRSLFKILPEEEFLEIFNQIRNKKRSNLRPEAENLVNIYMRKVYVSE